MTNLCRILVFLSFSGTLLGVLRNQGALLHMALALLVGIFLVALWFHLSLWWYWRNLKTFRSVASRELDISNRTNFYQSHFSGTLWQDRETEVEFTAISRGPSPGSVRVDDLISPKLIASSPGDTVGVFDWGDVVQLRYTVSPVAAGSASFFGVRFVFQDPFGLFVRVRTLRHVYRFQALPTYDRRGDIKPIIKRVNALPRQGIHSLQRAGLGSELLELREYQPGDPPKAIAWKISARRDLLMTRQYQSEVPIRIQLFVEGGVDLRRGIYGNRPVDWMSQLGASLVHAAVQAGDPVTLTLLDPNRIRLVDNLVGDRGFHQSLRELASYADEKSELAAAQSLIDAKAIGLAQWVTRQWAPDLLDYRVNTMLHSWFPTVTKKARQRIARRALSGVFTEAFRLSTKTGMRMLWDDALFGHYLAEYLERFEFPTPPQRLSGNHHPETTLNHRYSRFANEIKKRVARAKDNQLFVFVSTALTPDNGDWMNAIAALTPVIRLAISKHHRVAIVGVGPDKANAVSHGSRQWHLDATDIAPENLRFQDTLVWAERIAERRKQGRTIQQIGQTLRQSGASYVMASPSMVANHVMSEADLIGRGRSSRATQR